MFVHQEDVHLLCEQRAVVNRRWVVMGRGRGLVRLNDQGTLWVIGSASTHAGRPGAVIVSQEVQKELVQRECSGDLCHGGNHIVQGSRCANQLDETQANAGSTGTCKQLDSVEMRKHRLCRSWL